jgi:hypothetical protein
MFSSQFGVRAIRSAQRPLLSLPFQGRAVLFGIFIRLRPSRSHQRPRRFSLHFEKFEAPPAVEQDGGEVSRQKLSILNATPRNS